MNEFLLQDRLQKIRQVINKYGEDNFYLSFSGGKDSTVLHNLLDMAIPGNKIPRVYADTGIELNIIRDFVMSLQEKDNRIIIIKPSKNIKDTLETYGYPFKSKEHSAVLGSFQNGNHTGIWVTKYLNRGGRYGCPGILKHQFTDDYVLKISDKCCKKMKEEPLNQWAKNNNKKYGILGIMRSETGRRSGAQCLAFVNGKFKNFQPLAPLDKHWEDWFIKNYNIEICDIYNEPYNFKRTGCKGCPFNPYLQKSLDILEKYFPSERKQCEIIWKPVYEEYRKLGYRLKKEDIENA